MTLRSIVSILKTRNYKIKWRSVEHNIYDETSSKSWVVALFGIIPIFGVGETNKSEHDLSEAEDSKKPGFNRR